MFVGKKIESNTVKLMPVLKIISKKVVVEQVADILTSAAVT